MFKLHNQSKEVRSKEKEKAEIVLCFENEKSFLVIEKVVK